MIGTKPFRRFVSILLTFVLLFNIIPMPTYAADDLDETVAATDE